MQACFPPPAPGCRSSASPHRCSVWLRTITLVVLLAASITRTLAAGSEIPRPAQPNILVMMADDMGIGDTSAYLGLRLTENASPIGKTLRTPNLDRLAETGVVFTDAYAPASMCSSTRYSVLTGRFAHRAYLKHQGWLPHGPNTPMIQRSLKTLPEMLRTSGYHTVGIGKYHVGISFDDGEGNPADDFHYHDVDFTKPLLDGPTHHGFDEYFGVPGNTEDPLDTEPRIMIRNEGLVFTDRTRMKRIGMEKRAGKILAAPDWDLRQLGPLYLREALAFLDGRTNNPDAPFFLYFVPNANHAQRNPSGEYAVPESVGGTKVKGQSRYTDGSAGSDREDMVWENDVVLGKLLDKLAETDDPRWPGHKLIDNTLVIFTSDNGPNTGDNLGRNQESGGLRGKKAKIWEGGIRVPFIVSWPGRIEGGQVNRSILSLTDLYATLARVVGHSLAPNEAQDSYDVLDYWMGTAALPDERPRVFFCHLGPPYANDALAIRQGNLKLIVDGGLAMPWSDGSGRGASVPVMFYDLAENLHEDGDELTGEPDAAAGRMAAKLLEIHNRGYARDLNLEPGPGMILYEGWHNLRNDITGEIGVEFRLRSGSREKWVSHLGMWDDHDRDKPVRPARALPTEYQRDLPAFSTTRAGTRGPDAPHTVRLLRLDSAVPSELASCVISPENPGELDGAFRYARLAEPVRLQPDTVYALLMSTGAGDGDQFHDPASFDGLSPVVHPAIVVDRSIMVRGGDLERRGAVPAFEDLSESYSRHRLPVGPTLRFKP